MSDKFHEKPVSRREFLKVAGIAGATIGVGAGLGGLLAACGEEEETTTTAAAATTTTAAGATTTSMAAETTTTVAAGAEMGREIKIGAVSPITGSLASFGGPDKWIVSYVLKAVGDGVVCGDGKLHPLSIIQLDSQSSPNRVAEVTQDLIFNEKVDMMVASSSPDTVNPAADQCEANEIPFLANFVLWQPFYLGRGATPDTTLHLDLDVPLRRGRRRLHAAWACGTRSQTNKTVAYLFPNDADGQAWFNPEKGLEPIPRRGRVHHRLQAGDVPAAVGGFHLPDLRLQEGRLRGLHRCPDAARFHDLLTAVRPAGVSAEDHDHEQGLAFPSDRRSHRRPRHRPVRPHGLASQFPL